MNRIITYFGLHSHINPKTTEIDHLTSFRTGMQKKRQELSGLEKRTSFILKTFSRINLVNFCFIILFFVFQAIPETFSVRMINEGEVFDENVTINVVEQTATFNVPSREGAVKANVVHDFRKVNFALSSAIVLFFLFYTDQTHSLRICECEYCV